MNACLPLRSVMILSTRGVTDVVAFVLTLVSSLHCAHGFDAEAMGFTALRREQPSLTGAGIFIAHAEAPENTNAWQVDPFHVNIAQPVSLFTWHSRLGTATTFPNAIGLPSTHAMSVGANLYGSAYGVALGVAHVDSYEAAYFYENIIVKNTAIQGQVVNQSFGFFADASLFEAAYDNFATSYNVLFVSGIGNVFGTTLTNVPPAPSSAYNGLAVGKYTGSNYTSTIGPSADGRAKPDIVALDSATSLTTPLVSGAAALLWQSGARNDAGAGTAALATNSATLKALLLNGAVKPPGWTNGPTRPLDARWGSGVLNVYNSYQQLRAGRRWPIAQSSMSAGTPHPPTSDTGNITSLRGWNHDTLTSTTSNDHVAHYFFDLPTNGVAFTLASTLVWKKEGALPLPNLDLFLYETRSNILVASSVSSVDNVEHLFVPRLPAGRYDLQVLKRGGAGQTGTVSYALAFDFAPRQLLITRGETNVVISWPISEAEFTLQVTSNLNSSIPWSNVSNAPVITNLFNTVTLPLNPSPQFFRLSRLFSELTIVTPPQDQNIRRGSNVTFTVSASRVPTGYQWRFNGTNIAGAIGPTLTLTNVQDANAGAYSVALFDGLESVASRDAVLNVGEPPRIIEHPQSQTVTAGSDVTFRVTAAGSLPLSFRWRNPAIITNMILNETTSLFTIRNVQTNTPRNYTVSITNFFGTAPLSSTAVLTVLPAP